MLYVDNANITDPRLNLALEEHLLRNVRSPKPMLLFYVNEPSVIIGRNQNVLEEVDTDYLKEHGIHLVRRLSGGGAVYHDPGNLNFSFITEGTGDLHNFAKFTEPVVAVLRRFGINAELQNKSSLFADGKKISGNAQYMTRGRMFSHGTLLFDTNLEHLLKALNPRHVPITSRAVQSVRSRVTNLRELLPSGMTIHNFKEALLHGIFGTTDVPKYGLTGEDWEQVERYANERYRSWQWNVGRSPKFTVRKRGLTAVGQIEVEITVEKGRIDKIDLIGNVPDPSARDGIVQSLLGVRYDPDTLAAALAGTDLRPYWGNEAVGALVDLLY